MSNDELHIEPLPKQMLDPGFNCLLGRDHSWKAKCLWKAISLSIVSEDGEPGGMAMAVIAAASGAADAETRTVR